MARCIASGIQSLCGFEPLNHDRLKQYFSLSRKSAVWARSAPVPRLADFQGFPGYLCIYCRIWWWGGRDYATMSWLPNIQTPSPQSDNFLLIKARAKILLSCHQDSWFISSSPSFHLLPRKHPVWHGPCRLIQPFGSLHPGRSPLPWQSGLGTTAFAGPEYSQFFSLGWRELANPQHFQGAGGYSWGGYPPFTQHLCKVKQPGRGNR